MYYLSNITHRSDIKPLTSDSYALRVVDPIRGYFVIVDLRNELYSNVFKDTMSEQALFYCYDCMKEAHEDGEKFFNGICKSFIEDDNNLTINN